MYYLLTYLVFHITTIYLLLHVVNAESPGLINKESIKDNIFPFIIILWSAPIFLLWAKLDK